MPVFGRYEYDPGNRVGRGGFATVYRAWDPLLKRQVAVKALSVDYAEDPDLRRRFLGEAQSLAGLQHPNLVTVYDVGETPERPWFAMELIEGQTLAQRLADGVPRSLDETINTISALAGALDLLHASGLVHRDVKAANVMIAEGRRPGAVVLMDLGIARAIDGSGHTSASVVMLSPESAAPEQIRGERAGPQADIYGLGVLAFHMLAGRPPFTGEPAALLHAHVYDAPPPLWELRPGLPNGIYAAIQEALAKKPEHRPNSAGRFAALLRAAAGMEAPLPPVHEQPTVRSNNMPAPPSGPQPVYGAPAQPSPPYGVAPQPSPPYGVPAQPSGPQPAYGAPAQPYGGPAQPAGPWQQPAPARPPGGGNTGIKIGAGLGAAAGLLLLILYLSGVFDDDKKQVIVTTTPSPTDVVITQTPSTTPPPTRPPTQPPTQPPTVPPTAPPTVAAGSLIGADNFSDSGRGLLPASSTSPAIRLAYANGEYVVAKTDPASDSIAVAYLAQKYGDITVAFDGRLVGELDGRFIAVMCRRGEGDKSSGYRLTLEPAAGSFSLARWDDGTETALIRTQTSAAIKKDTATNRIALSCAGSTIAASINGVLVGSVQDTRYTTGDVWLGAAPYLNRLPGTSEARITNLVLTRPPSGSRTPVLFQENFNDANRGLFVIRSDEPSKYTFAYDNGEYAIRVVDPSFDRLPLTNLPGEYTNATLSIDTRLVGDTADRYIALACRAGSNGHYRLIIEPNRGIFRLIRRTGDSEAVDLVPEKESPAIRRGNGANHVDFTCNASTITIAINGTEVASVQDSTHTSGGMWIAGGVYTGKRQTSDVRFDNLVATQR